MSNVKIAVIAYHEAGHAVIGLRCGLSVSDVLITRSVKVGLTIFEPQLRAPRLGKITDGNIHQAWLRSLDRYSNHIRMFLAGPLAEAKMLRKPMRSMGAKSDLQRAKQLAQRLEDLHIELSLYTSIPWPERDGYLNHLRMETRRLIGQPVMWDMIKSVAEQLAHRRYLSGCDIGAILQQNCTHFGQLGLRDIFKDSGKHEGATLGASV